MTDFLAAMEATWPAGSTQDRGPWRIREGRGGGKRVSAASLIGAGSADPAPAVAAMKALGQPPIFQIVPGQEALDRDLAAQGYDRVDPVILYAAPVSELTRIQPPPLSAFALEEPLAAIFEIWEECDIGAGRFAVMDRVQGPRAYLLGRVEDRAAGAAFVALHAEIAMIHALEVLPMLRRKGVAGNMMHEAARWAQTRGGKQFALAVTEANVPARALYSGLGMVEVGRYHYRMRAAG